MKKIYSIITALFGMLSLSANAAEVPGNGATITASTIYALPIEGENGYVADNMLKLQESVKSGQYIVAFLNAPKIADAIDFKNIFYNDNGRQYTASGMVTNSNDNTFSYRRYYQAGTQNGIDIYAEDMNRVGSGYTWCYVIVNSEMEATTVANPADKGSDKPAVLGQDIANAIMMADGQPTTYSSVISGNNNILYVKFKAEKTGVATINLYKQNTSYAKWMQDGVMAYGALKQNEFINGNQIKVDEGMTYYCYYNFPSAVTGKQISYSITEANEGEARGKAILISDDGLQSLHGVAPHREGDYMVYTNTTTWYKLDRSALAGKEIMSVAIGGGNETDISLFINDEYMPVKSYAMGSGSGMMMINSTVNFDIDLSTNDYYIAITQDKDKGTAKFTFSSSTPGMTIKTAIETNLGNNSVQADKWYKYTHSGDNVITISGVSLVCNENEGLIADASDASSVGFRMTDDETVYFKPSGSTVKISAKNISAGEYPDNPIIITGKSFSITLSGGSSDTQRYMQYTATANGTFMYGTSNATVVESAFGALVRDVTTGSVVDITKEERSYSSKMYVYEWHVEKGHTYLIEQTLQNGMGTVNFQTVFTGDNPTAVNNIATDNANTASYNVVGQRVNTNAKGIVIRNGKKYVK